MMATDIQLNDSVCSLVIGLFGFFPGVLSVSLRQHHYFSQQEGPAQRNIAMPYKGKGASPSASKTLVRPKYHPCLLYLKSK